MSGFFAPDSRFMRYMSRLADLMLLNLLFLLTSIPIVTIGASKTALYSVCFRLGTDREGGTVRDYFQAFRENFAQATGLWLLEVLLVGSTLLCALLFRSMNGWLHGLRVLFLGLCVVAVMLFGYAFPLLSRFENSVWGTLRNGLLLSVGYLPRSLVIGALNVFPFAMMVVDFYSFLKVAFLWVALWFAAAAYANCQLLKKVFAPYLAQEEEEKEC